MNHVRIGRSQLRIMKVIWKLGSATAKQITDELPGKSGVALSTVQTLLRQLESKGVVRHEANGRTFVFYPVIDQRSVASSATKDLIDRLFGGSAAGLVAHLLKQERVSPNEIDAIREMIDEHTNPKKGKS
jgi:BlaI family penicillinase repressor